MCYIHTHVCSYILMIKRGCKIYEVPLCLFLINIFMMIDNINLYDSLMDIAVDIGILYQFPYTADSKRSISSCQNLCCNFMFS